MMNYLIVLARHALDIVAQEYGEKTRTKVSKVSGIVIHFGKRLD